MAALDKAWKDLNAKQREKYGSRSAFKEAKDDHRKSELYSNNWANLDAEQRKGFDDRRDYTQSRKQYAQDVRNNAGGMDAKGDAFTGKNWHKQLEGKEYGDMSEKYQGRVSEEEFNKRQDSQRMAGEALAGGKTAKDMRKDAYNVENLEDFDLRATGAGGVFSKRYYDGGDDDGSTNKLGRGGARLSSGDVRGLVRAGNDKQALLDYAAKIESGEIEGKIGKRAETLLAKYKDELTNTPLPEEETTPTPTPTPETEEETTTPTPTPDPTPDPDDEQTDDTLPVSPTPTPTTNQGGDGQTGNNTGGDTGGNTGNTDGNNSGNTGAGSGNTNTGDGVAGGSGNTGGGNTQTGQVNQVGAGSVNTGGNEQNTEVNYGNDETTINGNNNTVDNSERFYGGDQNNMSIVYGDGANQYNTAPLSDLTTLGYGKPSDSPSNQAQYVDFYQDLNKQAQKSYTGASDTAYKYIQNAAATNPISTLR